MGCVNTYRLFTDFYSYDAIARPTTRTMNERSDTFAYNAKSELTAAQLGSNNYSYAYDNIGSRKTAQEIAEEITYYTNSTNAYTAINDFTPEFDADGNQTRLQTSTGIWAVEYNTANRPTKFTSQDGSTLIESAYDYMGRRAWKKTTVDGEVTANERYLYRGYLQIAAIDLTRSTLNALYYLIWDPTEPTATRPLALQRYGSWFTYGLDISKNVKELFNSSGSVATTYDYSPFGAASRSGSTKSPVQWSSEMTDDELGLVYYNYRHYNPQDGRWINRDPIGIKGGLNLYGFVSNYIHTIDTKGEISINECNATLANVLKNPGAHSKHVRILIDILKKKNCMPSISCKCGTPEDLANENMGGYSINGSIELITEMLDDANAVLETLVHELIHAKQHCEKGWAKDCETLVCWEIQAYREDGECQRQTGTSVRQCIINGATSSSLGCYMDMGYSDREAERQARAVATQVYEQCYAEYGNPFVD